MNEALNVGFLLVMGKDEQKGVFQTWNSLFLE
jgi:hypothetical protein